MSGTYFIGKIKCSVCGKISPSDTTIQINSGLMPDSRIYIFQVGDVVPATTGDFEATYIPLKQQEQGVPIRLLERWECPSCFRFNWAALTFSNGIFTAISSIVLDRQNIRQFHYLTEWITDYYKDRTGRSLTTDEGAEEEMIEQLQEILPA